MRKLMVPLFILGVLVCGEPPHAQAPAKDVVVVVDNSGSMKKNDPGFLAKKAVTEFIGKLSGDTRAQIIIFDEKVRVAVPFTEVSDGSRPALIASLDGVNYRGKFTDSPSAVERAIYDLKTVGRKEAAKVIVFMTDGIVDTGDAARDAQSTAWLREDLSADAADAGIRIFAVAYTENADFRLIQSLAQRTQGEYFRALTAAELPAVFEKIDTAISTARAAAPPPEPVAPPPVVTAPPATPAEPTPPAATEGEAEIGAELPPGTVVIQPPEPTTAEKWMGLAIVLVGGLVIGGIIFGLVVLLRRKPAPASAPAAARAQPDVPKAYLNDINKITSDPAYEIGARPVMLGRVAGTERDLDHIVINQSTVGRRHALIEYKDFSFFIIDQGSVNGTYVNGERVTDERRLKHGDRIRLHNFEFEFVVPELEDSGKTVFSGVPVGEMAEKTLVAGSTAALAGMGTQAHAAPAAPAAHAAHAAPAAEEEDEDFLDITGTAATRAAAVHPAPPPPVDVDDLFEIGPDSPEEETADAFAMEAEPVPIAAEPHVEVEAEAEAEPEVELEAETGAQAEVFAAFAEAEQAEEAETDDRDVTIDDFMSMGEDGGDDTEMLAVQAPAPQAPPAEVEAAPAEPVPFHELDTFVREGAEAAAPAEDVTMDAFISTKLFDRPPPMSSKSPTVSAFTPPAPEIGSEDPTIRPAVRPAAVQVQSEDATVSPFIPAEPEDAEAGEELSLDDFMDAASFDEASPDSDRTELMVEDKGPPKVAAGDRGRPKVAAEDADRTKLMVEDDDRTRLMTEDDDQDDRTLMPEDVPDPRDRRR